MDDPAIPVRILFAKSLSNSTRFCFCFKSPSCPEMPDSRCCSSASEDLEGESDYSAPPGEVTSATRSGPISSPQPQGTLAIRIAGSVPAGLVASLASIAGTSCQWTQSSCLAPRPGSRHEPCRHSVSKSIRIGDPFPPRSSCPCSGRLGICCRAVVVGPHEMREAGAANVGAGDEVVRERPIETWACAAASAGNRQPIDGSTSRGPWGIGTGAERQYRVTVEMRPPFAKAPLRRHPSHLCTQGIRAYSHLICLGGTPLNRSKTPRAGSWSRKT